MRDWRSVRSDFPVTRDKVYFMNAAMSPTPRPVFERIVSEYRKIHEHGDIFWDEDVQHHQALRNRVGTMIGASGSDVAFVANTSTAMALMALSLRQHGPQDFNVVSMIDEFPASTVPFEHQGICMRYVDPLSGRYPVDRVLAHVDAKTLAVVTSHVQYGTGFRQDVATLGTELAKRNVRFIVNATQSFPIFPLDVRAMHIDAVTCSLHKWGMVGHVGALLFTSAAFRRTFPSPIAGWLSIASPSGLIHTAKNAPFELKEDAEQYIAGCLNFQAINPIAAALDYLESVGVDAARERIFALSDLLLERLVAVNATVVTPVRSREERSGIIAFHLGAKTELLPTYLADRGIHVSFRNGNVRVAINFFNNEEDVERLVQALQEFQAHG